MTVSSPPKLITSPLRMWGRGGGGGKKVPKKLDMDLVTTPRVDDGSTPRLGDESPGDESNDEGFHDLEVIRHESSFGGEGASSRGEFAGLKAPMNMAITPAGDILVADTGNHRIAILSTSGQLRELLGEELLRHPRGVACDATAIYVSEPGANGRVQKMRLPDHLRSSGAATPRGAQLGELSAQNQDEGPAHLTFPQGLALGNHLLYVADCEDHRIVAYDSQVCPLGLVW